MPRRPARPRRPAIFRARRESGRDKSRRRGASAHGRMRRAQSKSLRGTGERRQHDQVRQRDVGDSPAAPNDTRKMPGVTNKREGDGNHEFFQKLLSACVEKTLASSGEKSMQRQSHARDRREQKCAHRGWAKPLHYSCAPARRRAELALVLGSTGTLKHWYWLY